MKLIFKAILVIVIALGPALPILLSVLDWGANTYQKAWAFTGVWIVGGVYMYRVIVWIDTMDKPEK